MVFFFFNRNFSELKTEILKERIMILKERIMGFFNRKGNRIENGYKNKMKQKYFGIS